MKPSLNRFLFLSCAIAGAISPSADAVDRFKANNTDNLSLGTSWDTLPTSSDVAVFDSTYATVGNLNTGALVQWQGIEIINPGGNVVINNSTIGQDVALGTAGVDMSAATVNLTLQRLRVDASQTWNIASGRTFNIGNSASVRTGVLSLGAGGPFTITKSGAGTVQLDTTNTAIGNVNWDIQAGLIRAIWNGSSAWGTGSITLGGGGIAVGTNFTGSVGNWTWNNNISLTNSTNSFIDNQNIAGADRWLKLEGVISGSGNLEFRDTGTGFTNLDAGFILAGTNTNTGTVTINSGVEVRVGGANAGTLDDIAGNNGKLAGDSALVTNNGTLTFGRRDSHAVANAISGTGNLRIGMISTLGGSATDVQVVTLTGTSTYTGRTIINNGVLSAGTLNSVAGGSASSNLGAPVTVANGTIDLGGGTLGGTLRYTGTGETTDRVINLAGTTGGGVLEQSGTGLLKFTSGFTATGSGIKTLSLQGSSAGTGEVSGAIIDNSGTNKTSLIKAGTGTWTLSGTNTYTGVTTIRGNNGTSGELRVSSIGNGGAAGNLGQATNVATNIVFGESGLTTGKLVYTGSGENTDRLFTLNGNAIIENNGSGALNFTNTGNLGKTSGILQTLTFGGTNGGSLAANIIKGGGSSNVEVIKTGAGTWTLAGTANTYTANTTVNAGTLIVNGNISTSALTTVKSGATLGGSGTVGALTIDSGGFLKPGNSPGITTVNGNYTQNGTLGVEIEGLAAGNGTGFHDQVIVNGTVTLNGVLSIDSFTGFTPVNGSLIFILLNDGTDAVSGTFTGLAQGALVGNYLGFDWQISYLADSAGNTFTGGNDIALTAVPEPAAALLGGMGLLVLLRRRR